MPELPEVETVKNILKTQLVGKKIIDVMVYYPKLVVKPDVASFQKKLMNQTIRDVKRRGKWLLFQLDQDVLLSHLRMEGRYYIKNQSEPLLKHEHVSFLLSDGKNLRYHDTRKFGRMYLYPNDQVLSKEPLLSLGLEPWDPILTGSYLKEKLKHKSIPIKTSLLDQTIISGIGNIYDNEILFRAKVNPHTPSHRLSEKRLDRIMKETRLVLEKAIAEGGTTIRTFEATGGVHGRFQQELMVHGKSICTVCHGKITKEMIGGRGTYYCKHCQK